MLTTIVVAILWTYVVLFALAVVACVLGSVRVALQGMWFELARAIHRR